MRKIPKGPRFAGAPKHRQHDGIEEKKMQGPFRQPTESEKKKLTPLIASNADRKTYDDIFWALLNSTEFAFNH